MKTIALLILCVSVAGAGPGDLTFEGLKTGQKFPVKEYKNRGCLFQPAKGGKLYIGVTKVEGEKDYHTGSTGSGKLTFKFYLPGTETPAITKKGGWSGVSVAITCLGPRKKIDSNSFDVVSYDINGIEISRFSDKDYTLVSLEKGVHKVEVIPRFAASKTCVSVIYRVGKKGYLAPASKAKGASLALLLP